MSKVEASSLDDGSIPFNKFHFVLLGEITNLEASIMIDVIGIAWFVSDLQTLSRKDGSELKKRTIQIIDTSNYAIDVTLWGDLSIVEGSQLQYLITMGPHPIVAFKCVRITYFYGKYLGTISNTKVFINPSIQEATVLINWCEEHGNIYNARSLTTHYQQGVLTSVKTNISEITARGSLSVENPIWLSLRGTIVSIDEMDCFTYPSCSSMHTGTSCRKKITKNYEGNWICSACDVISADCDYRYLFRVQIVDHTENLWATLFDDAGKYLIGATGKETYG
ncbi:hypothetical protein KI387_017663 [Taxus chinensis]|uniref:Replication protein A OB domain-containing protein n=1 Tax=Taxus chinensis TaxID=29808 RepID=A0AA38GJN7_TAXCH|nr:hypothetical protein KI387_017663 [Taxus chinensis]